MAEDEEALNRMECVALEAALLGDGANCQKDGIFPKWQMSMRKE